MDIITWNWIKDLLQYLCIAVVGWVYAAHQKEKQRVNLRIDLLHDKITVLEISNEVTKVMIKNICEDVVEIKTGVIKIVDKLDAK